MSKLALITAALALLALPATAQEAAATVTLLDQSGTADPGIRSAVGAPDTHTVDKGSVTRAIVAAPQGDGREAQAVIPGQS